MADREMDKLIEYMADAVETLDFQRLLASAVSTELTIGRNNPAVHNADVLISEATKSVDESYLEEQKTELLQNLESKKLSCSGDASAYKTKLYKNIVYLAYNYAMNLDILVSYRNTWPTSFDDLASTIAGFVHNLIEVSLTPESIALFLEKSDLTDQQLEEHYVQNYLQYLISLGVLRLPYLYSNIKQTIDTYPINLTIEAINFELTKVAIRWSDFVLDR